MQTDKIISVVIVEDDDTIRSAYSSIINDTANITVIGSYSNAEDALKQYDEDQPDIILMDINLPGISGIEAILKIKKRNSSANIIVLTVHDDHEIVFNALCAGANGYLTKNVDPQKLISSIGDAHKGGAPMSSKIANMVVKSFHTTTESPLTSRETEILQKIARGKSYSIIAEELFISKDTVKSHIKNIYRKLEVNSKSSAIDVALKKRII